MSLTIQEPPQHEPSRLLQRLAWTTAGAARAHVGLASEESPRALEHLMLAGSGFAIAASFWSMIDPREALQNYTEAAGVYRGLGHPYWIPLAMAAIREGDVIESASAVSERPTPLGVAFAMLGASMTGERSRDSGALNESWRHFGNAPIGRLGVPLDVYGTTAEAMWVALREKEVARFRAQAAQYVHRAAEVIRSASHDQYHWSLFQSAILPAEPEAVAVTAAMSIVARRAFGTTLASMMEDARLDEHGWRLVRVGGDLHAVSADLP